MYLEEFFDYKNQLMKDILSNQAIVDLLCHDGVPGDARELAYTQVFPYEYVPETIEHGKTFICFDVDVQRGPYGKTLLDPMIYIWVFTHKSLMRLPEGGVRVDAIVHEIAKEIDGSRRYGLGELNIYAVRRFSPQTDYQGKVMSFSATDFNRLSPTGKQVPTNRKYG